MRVLDIAVADQDPVIVAVAMALLQWYDLVCVPRPSAADVARLSVALHTLREALDPFVAVGVSLNTPKMHRAKDVPQVMRTFGAAKFVSTDAYEMAHKTLKSVMRRYVLAFDLFP